LFCKAWRDFHNNGNTGVDWGKEYIKIMFVELDTKACRLQNPIAEKMQPSAQFDLTNIYLISFVSCALLKSKQI